MRLLSEIFYTSNSLWPVSILSIRCQNPNFCLSLLNAVKFKTNSWKKNSKVKVLICKHFYTCVTLCELHFYGLSLRGWDQGTSLQNICDSTGLFCRQSQGFSGPCVTTPCTTCSACCHLQRWALKVNSVWKEDSSARMFSAQGNTSHLCWCE